MKVITNDDDDDDDNNNNNNNNNKQKTRKTLQDLQSNENKFSFGHNMQR